jgi:hypothetical protein
MSAEIAALDNALSGVGGEWVTLRRVVGTAPNTVNIDVQCRARVDGVTPQEIASGISQDELHVIMSPTQINAAQWPGGQVTPAAPFSVDPRIPVKATDKVIARGKSRTLTFIDPRLCDGELVRLNLRVSG